MTAGAPDITEVETDRQTAPTEKAFVSAFRRREEWVVWGVSSAIFVITAAATFGGALGLSNSRPHAIPVVRIATTTLPAATVPVVSAPVPAAVDPPKPKSMDEVSAYDERPHRSVIKRRKDEGAAYNPRTATKTAPPKDQANGSPATNW